MVLYDTSIPANRMQQILRILHDPAICRARNMLVEQPIRQFSGRMERSVLIIGND